jgi:hypothetical protein
LLSFWIFGSVPALSNRQVASGYSDGQTNCIAGHSIVRRSCPGSLRLTHRPLWRLMAGSHHFVVPKTEDFLGCFATNHGNQWSRTPSCHHGLGAPNKGKLRNNDESIICDVSFFFQSRVMWVLGTRRYFNTCHAKTHSEIDGLCLPPSDHDEWCDRVRYAPESCQIQWLCITRISLDCFHHDYE